MLTQSLPLCITQKGCYKQNIPESWPRAELCWGLAAWRLATCLSSSVADLAWRSLSSPCAVIPLTSHLVYCLLLVFSRITGRYFLVIPVVPGRYIPSSTRATPFVPDAALHFSREVYLTHGRPSHFFLAPTSLTQRLPRLDGGRPGEACQGSWRH